MPTRTLCLLAVLILGPGCDSQADDPILEGRGAVVSTKLLHSLTTTEVQAYGFPVNATYSVDLYQVVYETIDPDGASTVASGAVAVPVGASGGRPLVSYQHGTEVLKDGVAGVGGIDVPEALVVVIFATSGYLAVMPDYLGLGVSPGLHPYVHGASLATSTIDLMRAARVAAGSWDINLSGEVFLTGYSEGGYATVAAQQVIEADHAVEFDLIASAPAAGSYDLSGTMAGTFRDTNPYPATYYMPYAMLAYDEIYDIYSSLSDAIRSPYDALIPGLYDGYHSAGQINDALPDIPVEMIEAAYVDAYDQESNHPFRVALRDNDNYDWAPRTPTRVYHCIEDDQIPFANAQLAYDTFVANGAASVELAPLDYGGHVDCVAPSLLFAKLWFDGMLGASKAEAPVFSRMEAARWSRRLYR